MQNDSRQDHGNHNTQLVDGYHLGCLTNLQGLIVTQPGGSRGNTGQDQEQPTPPADLRNAALRVRDEHHPPGHQQHNKGADGCRKVGVYPLNADLG